MENKTVIIEGSARKNGDTHRVIEALNDTTTFDVVSLLDYSIGHYDYTNANSNDDFISLMESLLSKYSTFIFITPVYWYTMSGRMKVFFDRISDLLHYKKELGRQLRGKNMALISVSNADDRIEGFSKPFEASAIYLGMHFLGDIHAWITSEQLSTVSKERLKAFKLEQLRRNS